MPFLTDQQIAAVSGSSVFIATLAEFHFRSDTSYLWNGTGVITVAGIQWSGLGGGGAVDSFPTMQGTSADMVTARLSAVDPEIVVLAKNSRDDVQGRPAYFWFQLFDADSQPLGNRIAAWWGIMQRIKIERTPAEGFDGGERTASLEIESIYAARGRSGSGRYTDSDQQYRYPGDKFCQYVTQQRTKTLKWPTYL